MAWWCKNWNALPEAGGIYDQDYGLVVSMITLENVYNAVHRVGQMVGEQIHQLTSNERKILKYLRDEGLMR